MILLKNKVEKSGRIMDCIGCVAADEKISFWV